MAYDRDSFLAGVAVGRNMESYPAFAAESMGVFMFTVEVDGTTGKSLTYGFSRFVWNGFKGLILWGDGSVSDYLETAYTADSITHTYAEAGTFQIKILYSAVMTAGAQLRQAFSTRSDSIGSLISIDAPIPALFSNIYQVYELAYGCVNLRSVVPGLFDNCPGITDADRVFSGCAALTLLPSGIFDKLTVARNFAYCLSGSGVTVIPDGLFAKCVEARSFHGAFEGCTGITSIPVDTFQNCVLASDFGYCFSGCTGLLSAPGWLLSDTAADDCIYIFRDCTSLASISAYLFAGCSSITILFGAFYGCRQLSEIPAGLLDDCTSATEVGYIFYQCYAVDEIPSGLFDHISIQTTSFSGSFGDTAILSIPSGLFDRFYNATDFGATFIRCGSLRAVPNDLFAYNMAATNFYNAFDGCGSIVSSVPELWVTHPTAGGRDCYHGCIHAANYEDIPAGWR